MVDEYSCNCGTGQRPASSMRSKTGLQPCPFRLSKVYSISSIIECQTSFTSGVSPSKLRSGHRRYTVIGFSLTIKSRAEKSDPEKQRTVVSVINAHNFEVNVPHADCRNLSLQSASSIRLSRNLAARWGEIIYSRAAAYLGPNWINWPI